MFDDVLPTAEKLRALGLAVSSDYDPRELHFHEIDGDDSDDPDRYSGGSTWTMSWDDGSA